MAKDEAKKLCNEEDQPNHPLEGEAITGGVSATHGSATLNGAGTGAGPLAGDYLRNPENTAAQVYDKEQQHKVREHGGNKAT